MALNYTSQILSLYAANVGNDANYESPGNFGLPFDTSGTVGVASVAVGTAGSYTTLIPTFTSGSGGSTFSTSVGLLTVATVATAGTKYVPSDTLNLVGGTSSITGQLSITNVKLVSATIHTGAGGTGYDGGSPATFTVSVAGGTHSVTATLSVTTNGSGVVTTINSISAAGVYTVLPTLSNNAATGDDGTHHGTGLGLDLVFGVNAASILTNGAYTVLPPVTVSTTDATTPAGTGATFTFTYKVVSVAVLNPGSYLAGGSAPVLTASSGSATATATLASASASVLATQKLLTFIEVLRSYIAETTTTNQLKDIHEILRKMMQEMKFGGTLTYSASNMATNARASAMNYIARNPTHSPQPSSGIAAGFGNGFVENDP